MRLAIDIGNTNIVYGVFNGETLIARFRVATNLRATGDEYGVTLLALLERHAIQPVLIGSVIIASVVPALDRAFRQTCETYLHLRPVFVGQEIQVPIDVAVERPEEVGADRLVNAYMAWKLYDSAALVIDLGTATSFDVVTAEGVYLGGAIAPGMEISGKALFEATSKLKKVELVKPERAIGKNTKEAIQSGLFLGYVGLIDFLVKRMKEELNESARVIATGGLAEPFAGVSSQIEEVNLDLTVCGLNKLLSDKDGL